MTRRPECGFLNLSDEADHEIFLVETTKPSCGLCAVNLGLFFHLTLPQETPF